MHNEHRHRRILTLVAVAIAMLLPTNPTSALAPGSYPFERTWQRTDGPVAGLQVSRTWMWGPEAFTAQMYEDYAESPGGKRIVQYFDKSRMEITFPDAVDDGMWYVTNGLLVVELVSGRMQTGASTFVNRSPAVVNVAGDANDPDGPTYATFETLTSAQPHPDESVITQQVSRSGVVTIDPAMAVHNVTAAVYESETNHRIASVFWEFMNVTGPIMQDGNTIHSRLFQTPYYATGLPITEAYWTKVRIDGTPHDVLVQCFQRRCLTYAPGHPAEWRVEMGNVGQHYYRWRYGVDIPSQPQPVEASAYREVGPAFLAQWPVELGGQAGLILANQSPYAMTVTLEGPVTATVVVPACPDCVVYSAPSQFAGCRDNIPERYVEVRPGNYRVKVEFDGASMPPSWAHWTLVPNGGYNTCFYSVMHE